MLGAITEPAGHRTIHFASIRDLFYFSRGGPRHLRAPPTNGTFLACSMATSARGSSMMGAPLRAGRRTAPVASRKTVAARAALEDAKGKKVCIITGASSGLGLHGAAAVAQQPDWHVVMAVRDFAKAEKAARSMNMDPKKYTIMHLDLASFTSVRQFADAFLKSGAPVNTLVANGAVYLPTAKEPTYSPDGYEISVATNHLGHFLLCNLLLPLLAKTDGARMIIVGSVTGNTNTLAGNIPPKADLGELQGMKAGFKEPISMIDGGEFDGAKAYKDSKVTTARGGAWGGEGGGARAEQRGELGGACSSLHSTAAFRRTTAPAGVQHADDARVPPPLPRQDGRGVLLPLPRVHCRLRPLPQPRPALPRPLPQVPEVRHQGLRLPDGGRAQAVRGGHGPQVHGQRGLLVLVRGGRVRGVHQHALGRGSGREQGPAALGAL